MFALSAVALASKRASRIVAPGDTTLPVIAGASVSNATPTRIDLTWSEPMNASVSAAAAFSVSAGHALTAHTYVDATHSYLTTSTAFVNGEAARTLSYTTPGSNKMQDLASNLLANFSGVSVTNNVDAVGGEPTGILWPTYTSAMWDEDEAYLASIGNPYWNGGLGAPSYRQRIADIEATTSGGTLLNPGDNISAAVAGVGAGGLVRLSGGAGGTEGLYTLTSDCALDGKRIVTVPGAKVRINCGSTDNAYNMRGSGGVLAAIGAGSYIKLTNGGNLGIAMFDLTDGGGVPLGNCKNNTLYRVWVDDMGNSAHDTTTGTSLSMFYGSANGLAVNCQFTNGTDDYTGGNCDGLNMANNKIAISGPAAGRVTSNCAMGCYVDRISDDAYDYWNSDVPQYLVRSTGTRSGLHPTHPSGDGNGVKTGVGTAQHEFFKCAFIGNKEYGANNNGNTLKSRYKTCDFTSVPNGLGQLAGSPTLYNVVA